MPDFPGLIGSSRIDTVGEDLSDSLGTTLTTDSGAANTKGVWAEIVASTSLDAIGILVHSFVTTGHRGFLVDIGVGGSGSEVVLIENIAVSGKNNISGIHYFPIHVGKAIRLSGRAQASSGTSIGIDVSVTLIGKPFLPQHDLSRVTTYGADTSDSGGTSVDPGGTANTKGTWVEISASTTNPMRALVLGLTSGGVTARQRAVHRFDISVGSATSEQVIVPDIPVWQDDAGDIFFPQGIGPIPVNIPAASRLAVRQQCTIIDATDRVADVVIYGVD